MKSAIAIALFVAIGLMTAVAVGFRPDLFGGAAAYDAEQEGLKERIVIKFSHVVAENTPKGLAAEHFARLVAEKTKGKAEVQVFPNGMLYDEDTEIAALRRGDIQMIAPSFSNVSNGIPEWYVLDLPFIFDSLDDVHAALNGEVGRLLFETLDRKGLKGLAFWDNGFRQMASSVRPLREPADFKGQRFRIQPSRVIEAQYRLLSAQTSAIPFNETYRALETGEVNAQENTLSNMFTKKLYRVQKYLTISNHSFLGYAVMTNGDFWNRLPSSVQTAIEESARETAAWIARKAAELNEDNLNRMKRDSGLTLYALSPDNRAALISVLEPLYAQFAREIGPELMARVRLPQP
ncbi:DctP family TRAP transporter solute-binding subunit [Cohnella sp. CFH 77786]|uniref:DctP family TRAP transporter solute-binding subunit n=1 Tax=Cohnella sp. CFH 77786 TaxID=2662265 RepID=UPI001C60C8CC|nr:DctP family TRAP transporter solute-binding subunit [Cohnella sp. CFH 77786]MBW5444948.1 DctP family TRAP transporter solute-binding subunit [Cohnella sp. CFH 77786]